MFIRCITVGLLVTLSALTAAQDAKSPLEGEWMWMVTHQGNDQINKAPVIRGDLKFEGNKVFVTYDKSGSGGADKKATGTYKYDAASKPARILLMDLPSEIPTTMIAKVEGDKLMICYHRLNGDLPDKFETKDGDQRELSEFHKKKNSN
jgi:uncharacterized protein (TIGR03067 family)